MYNALINPSLDKILDYFISHGKVGGGAGESREGGEAMQEILLKKGNFRRNDLKHSHYNHIFQIFQGTVHMEKVNSRQRIFSYLRLLYLSHGSFPTREGRKCLNE